MRRRWQARPGRVERRDPVRAPGHHAWRQPSPVSDVPGAQEKGWVEDVKVSELQRVLSAFDPDTEVIIQRDPEGNGYSPLEGVEHAWWVAEESEACRCEELGYFGKTMDTVDACIVLFPRS